MCGHSTHFDRTFYFMLVVFVAKLTHAHTCDPIRANLNMYSLNVNGNYVQLNLCVRACVQNSNGNYIKDRQILSKRMTWLNWHWIEPNLTEQNRSEGEWAEESHTATHSSKRNESQSEPIWRMREKCVWDCELNRYFGQYVPIGTNSCQYWNQCPIWKLSMDQASKFENNNEWWCNYQWAVDWNKQMNQNYIAHQVNFSQFEQKMCLSDKHNEI